MISPPTTVIYTLSLHDALPISVNEDGSPVDLTRLPGRLVLEGREAEPLVLRATDNRTGEQRWRRSEEHTSELQSHSDLVCRLLLEKKKYGKFLDAHSVA